MWIRRSAYQAALDAAFDAGARSRDNEVRRLEAEADRLAAQVERLQDALIRVQRVERGMPEVPGVQRESKVLTRGIIEAVEEWEGVETRAMLFADAQALWDSGHSEDEVIAKVRGG